MATTTATKPARPRQASPAKPPLTCSLLAVINGQMYRAGRIGPRAWRLAKLGPENLVYDVVAGDDGIRCDCGDFTYRRDGITPDPCKHGMALIDLGLLPEGARR